MTGQRSDQLSYVPRLHFQQLGLMSHRMSGFAEFAIFALFYLFAGLDSISSLGGHQVDTKSANPTTNSSLSDELVLTLASRNESDRRIQGTDHGGTSTRMGSRAPAEL